MTIPELLDYGKCYGCLGLTTAQTAELALLDLILANGGAGGGGTVQVYENRDPAPPDDPTKAALSFPTGGGTITQWPPNGPAWV